MWRNPTLLKILLALPAIAGVILLIYQVSGYESPAHKQIRRSAEDVLILYTAMKNYRGQCPLYPDWAYRSEGERARYGLLPDMPQARIDKFLSLGGAEPENIDFYRYHETNSPPFTSQFNPYHIDLTLGLLTLGQEQQFQRRMMKWRMIDRYGPQLIRFDMQVRLHLTSAELEQKLKKEMTDRRIASVELERDLSQRTVIPIDPFAGNGADPVYRYGLSPRKIIQKTATIQRRANEPAVITHYNEMPLAAFIIAGNGPDGVADVDVTHFDAEESTRTQKSDPTLGLGRDPVDLIYDPTNGARSGGDIFIIMPAPTPPPPGANWPSYGLNQLPYSNPAATGPRLGPKALWDEGEFKKRYGLK